MSNISTITAGISPQAPARQSEKSRPAPAQGAAKRESRQNLASSIMADGGLSFLRSRLEEKLESLFDDATEQGNLPEGVQAGSFLATEVDVSPEATAGRIVGFALSLMGTYRRQNSDLDEHELRAGFETEIRQGIAAGFDHARGVLGDLEMQTSDTEENVNSTWDWVQQMLADHFRDEA